MASVSAERDSQCAVPRICICGAGVAGLTLAGILSKSLTSRVKITVLERAPADYDQGYGLDLDSHGQEALARAGVYHRYWEISQPHSDCAKLMPLKGSEPLAVLFRPTLLQRLFPSWFGARPETNRGKLRDVLLEAMAERDNVEIQFEKSACDIREHTVLGRRVVQLLDQSGCVLGEYDFVIDAMGLHSPLRQHVVDDPQGKHFTGQVLMHGVIRDPEAVFPTQLMQRFSHFGTYGVFGKGYGLFMQRFGGLGDKRTCFFYMIPECVGDEASIFEQVGIQKPTSRSSGIISSKDDLDKVKAWIKRDMANHFDPLYYELVDCLERITIRGEHSHGHTALRADASLPLVCIGDSLRHCGLGGGGILAMQDAIELADLLEEQLLREDSGVIDVKALRVAQRTMLERKNEHMKEKNEGPRKIMSVRDGGDDASLHLKHFVSNPLKRVVLRGALYFAALLFKKWYQIEARFTLVGSTSNSPIYPSVTALL